MQLKFMSVFVQDQDAALKFYTNVLGFSKMADIPIGEYRWLTVVSPDGVDGVELVLEPMGFAPARDYQKSLFEAGIPAIALISHEIQKDYARLSKLGIKFRSEPISMGVITSTKFEDPCGNLINLVQPSNLP
jgi:catechol 2,3-dioxygenase-like lactoylglutathione lyase family enzyme